MDVRIKERRRAVGKSRGRRRLAILLGLVAVIVLAVGFVWLRSSDVFAVRYVSVPVGEHVSADALRAVVAPATGKSLLVVSTSDLEQGVQALPWVRSARVYRHFPDSLEVSFEEHIPVAEVRDPDGVDWLLAEDGTVLEQAPPDSPALPRIVIKADIRPKAGATVPLKVAEGIPLALELGSGRLWPVDTMPFDYITVLASGDLVVQLQGGGEVRLGDTEDLDLKFTVAQRIVEEYLRDGETLEYVDVRVPSRPVAKAR
jgi:cell division septal protein FtsQ